MFAAADARQDALPMADLVDIQNRRQLHVPDPLDALHVVVQVLVKSVEVLLQVDAIQPGFHRVLLVVVVVVVEGLVVDLEGELLDRVQDNLTLELARDSHLPPSRCLPALRSFTSSDTWDNSLDNSSYLPES
jgi:hypothetical protein